VQALSAGFLLSLSLIVAIGAQNALVLRQGIRRDFVFAVCLTCAVSDAILIAAGVSGFGWVANAAPWIAPMFRYGGVVFLIWYGFLNARAAVRGGEALAESKEQGSSLKKVVLASLAITWLNPHVYLDTLVLLGSVSTGYENRLAFGTGAVAASFLFFFFLGYGARLLGPVFARPNAWRVLDAGVALTMWVIAIGLLIE